MASFDAVNYSLRPSKSIQRNLVFDDIRTLKNAVGINDYLYIGFGSVWFVDFVLAHKLLGSKRLISLEGNDIGYTRASFNIPYSCVSVEHGFSNKVLPKLYARGDLDNGPWFMWLDYDYAFNDDVKDDIRLALEKLPPDSIFVTTFNAMPHKYAQKLVDRRGSLKSLFGDLVPNNLPRAAFEKEEFVALIKACVLKFMKSVVADGARAGGFVPCVDIAYKDQSWMVTVGGVLPSEGNREKVQNVIGSDSWKSIVPNLIVAPHLTAKEAATLQALMPGPALNRAAVQALGFDLEDEQIRAFCDFYLYYPNFAQVVT